MTDHLKTIREALQSVVGADDWRKIEAGLAAITLLEQAMREPVSLNHIACIEDGELRYMSGRKAPEHDCELYAMPDGKSAPPLFAAPPAQQARECGVCGSDKAFSGPCGGGRNNPKALCYETPAQQAQPTESDVIAELNHAQWLALENVRTLANRNRKEEWAQHLLRFVEEAGTNKAQIMRRQVEQAQRPDFHDEWTGFLKDGETPFERFMRERKDLDSLTKLYQRALEENEQLKVQQSQTEAVPQGMVVIGWEYRWFDSSPYTVTSGKWSEWERVVPRNPHMETAADRMQEIQRYIDSGMGKYELRTLYAVTQHAEPDALKLHAIEELCQLGYTVKDGELFPPDHLHKLMEAAGHPLAAQPAQPAYWMVECKNGFTGWATKIGKFDCRFFDTDPLKAKRFATKSEAEAEIASKGNSCMVATEHQDIEAPAQQADIRRMVDRFLGWKLPDNFNPDAGISFKPYHPQQTPGSAFWPSGTNLLTAEQAKAMFEYVLEGQQQAQPSDFADAYQGAMEEVAIWKRRALEAEELNRKFMAEINGATFMGEPAQQAQPTDLQAIEQYRMQMAGISTAAIGYWKESDSIHPDYDTVAMRDVAKLYAKYDELYRKQAQAEAVPTFTVEDPDLHNLLNAAASMVEGKANHDIGMMYLQSLERVEARLKQTEAVPQGWKLVPVEPTPEMVDALINITHWTDDPIKGLGAAIAAAPQQKGGGND